MSKQKKQQETNNAHGGYELKTDAIDRLVGAEKKSYPKSNVDPGKQYRSKGFFDKIPEPIKALFIKFWFNGAVCFFILWGLGTYIWDMLDMLVVLGIVLGIVTDILVNNAFHFFAVTPGSNNKWMMFPKRKFWTFFANIIYSFFILLIVVWIYNSINVLGNMISGTEGVIYLGVEPIVFGVFYVAVDMIFIGMKNLFFKIITEAKEKVNLK